MVTLNAASTQAECAASLSWLRAHAKQSDAETKQFTTLRARAEQGDAQAQSELADAYFLDSLVPWIDH